MGYEEYIPLATKYKVPIVVTGFEPVDILQGVYMTVKQLEEGRYEVENQYTRSVRREGNIGAQQLMKNVYDVTDRKWRGMGEIPSSGLKLKKEFSDYDAELKFDVAEFTLQESPLCIAGEVLRGLKRPRECAAFGTQCTPEHPLGAPMVSSEGACAAYYQYGRFQTSPEVTTQPR
jgi:hydrogenase expression/formation protein HypD